MITRHWSVVLVIQEDPFPVGLQGAVESLECLGETSSELSISAWDHLFENVSRGTPFLLNEFFVKNP